MPPSAVRRAGEGAGAVATYAPPPRTTMSASRPRRSTRLQEGDHTETAATATSSPAGQRPRDALRGRRRGLRQERASPYMVLGIARARDGDTAHTHTHTPFVERTVKLLALASVWAYWSAGVAYLPTSACCSNSRDVAITPWRSTCPFS